MAGGMVRSSNEGSADEQITGVNNFSVLQRRNELDKYDGGLQDSALQPASELSFVEQDTNDNFKEFKERLYQASQRA